MPDESRPFLARVLLAALFICAVLFGVFYMAGHGKNSASLSLADSWQTHYDHAIQFYNLRDYPSAIEEFILVLSKNPKNADGWNFLGVSYGRTHQFRKAIDSFNASLTLRPKYSETYRLYGMILYEADEFEDAIPLFNTSIALNPQNPLAYNGAGSSYQQLGDSALAWHFYQASLELDPSNPLTKDAVGTYYFLTGNHTAAKDYLSYSAREQDWDKNYFYLTNLLMLQDYDGIIKTTTLIKLSRPEEKNAYSFSGAAYILKGMPKEAISDYRVALNLSGKDRSRLHYNNLGLSIAYLLGGDHANATIHLERSMDYSASGDAHLTKGVLLGLEGDAKGSETSWDRASFLRIDITTFGLLGSIYHSRNDFKGESRIYDFGLRYYPKSSYLLEKSENTRKLWGGEIV
jgi:tetratricopeptide (TPR) repeat protein